MKIKKVHYAWVILAVCFALYGGSMGIGYNCGGLFNVAISNDMGWSISQFTVSTLLLGLASVLTLNIVDKVLNRFNLRIVLALSLSVYAGTLALKAACNELWQFYLVYAINGASSAFLFFVPVPMLLNNWFRKKGGTALGIAMISSGLIGTLMNPFISKLIESFGWRSAAIINGAMSAAFSIPLVLLFTCRRPEDMGLKPYGDTDGEGTEGSVEEYEKKNPIRKEKLSVDTSEHEEDIEEQLLKRHVNLNVLMGLSCILAVAVVILSMIPQQLSHFASVNGFPAATGALFVSIAMAGNMSSKALMGGSIDRFGTRKTFTVSFLLVALAFLGLAFYFAIPEAILYLMAFLTGITAANNVIVMPYIVKVFTNDGNYTTYMSKVSMASMIGIAFGTYVCSLIYDLAGSYTIEFLLYIVVDLLCLGIVLYIIPPKQ